MRCWLYLLALVAGCGVELQVEPPGSVPDASTIDGRRPTDTPLPDAMPSVDARPCAGGDSSTTAPDGSCFVLFTTPSTYAEAVASCEQLGSHLAILSTAAMNEAAESHIGTLNTLIGLTDRAAEGTYVWSDGSALMFTAWHAGEPNDAANEYPEDCVIIAGGRADKGWDDRPCEPVPNVPSGRYAYLCQY